MAAENGHMDIIDFLCGAGADVNTKNKNGVSIWDRNIEAYAHIF